MKLISIFCIISLMQLCASVCPVLAKAPLTPKILFTSARDGNRDVYIMNPDGSEQVNLTQHPADDQRAVWSPNGEQILFVSDRGGVRDLYLMDPDGSKIRRVFKSKMEDWRINPTWSPDGKQFAYARVNWDKLMFTLYIAPLGKQEEEEFSMDSSDPAWSPDGTEIACVVGGRITLINVRTGAQKQLLPKKVESFQRFASWSAAGDKLAFSWNNNPLPPDLLPGQPVPDAWLEKETIYIVNRDGIGLQQIVDEVGPEAIYPVLSPRGDELLYTQKIDGRLQISKIEVNSGIRTQLTHIGLIAQANAGGDWFDPATLPVSPQPHLLTTIWGQVKREDDP